MKNYEIIANEAINQGLYTKEEVEKIFASGEILPLYTYQELKKSGYQVRKGEKAVLQCKIWNHKTPKNPETKKEDDEMDGYYYLHLASFFRVDQADKIQ